MKTVKIVTLFILLAAPFTQAADIAAGKAKAAVCAACHGQNGIGTSPLYPNLAGQKAPYLLKQLQAFKDGSRKDASMTLFVTPLNDTDMKNIAAYYESLTIDGQTAGD